MQKWIIAGTEYPSFFKNCLCYFPYEWFKCCICNIISYVHDVVTNITFRNLLSGFQEGASIHN